MTGGANIKSHGIVFSAVVSFCLCRCGELSRVYLHMCATRVIKTQGDALSFSGYCCWFSFGENCCFVTLHSQTLYT